MVVPTDHLQLPGIAALLTDPQFLAALSGQTSAILLLDYDGVLAPFTTQRDKAYPYPGVIDELSAIPVTGDGRFIMVSGRRASEIGPLLRLDPQPEIWGCHGAERILTSGEVQTTHISDIQQHALNEAHCQIATLLDEHRIEIKPFSLAVHLRNLNVRQTLEAEIRQSWKIFTQSHILELHAFDGGLELRIPDCNKGNAVRTIAREFPESVLVYLGDDHTDEDAFQVIRGTGIPILTRQNYRESSATYWIRPPYELISVLGAWRNRTPHSSPFKV